MTEIATDRRCPVLGFEYVRPAVPALSLFAQLDEFRGQARPAFWAPEGAGYWVFTDHDVILDGLQRPDLWSSSIITPHERSTAFTLIPVMVDPPEHAKWRQLLAEWFSPKRVRSMRDEQQRIANPVIGGGVEVRVCLPYVETTDGTKQPSLYVPVAIGETQWGGALHGNSHGSR